MVTTVATSLHRPPPLPSNVNASLLLPSRNVVASAGVSPQKFPQPKPQLIRASASASVGIGMEGRRGRKKRETKKMGTADGFSLHEIAPVTKVTDEDKLHSFVDSYKFGAMMMKDMEALSLSTLDANLTPEHLLYVCLEYKQKFTPFQQSSHVYNFYKDSNAPELSKVIKPLTTLQEKAKSFLNEWPDHPGLQKILDVAQMLLGLPVDTPLAKALLGLQFLLSRARALHENDSRFSFSDQLQPIFDMVFSWQNLELESWPTLLDGVLEQYEFNAGKLWFPLHLVLHRQPSGNIVRDNLSTIQSLEEFVQTASVGEFKKRLELLVAFHGQLNASIRLKAHSRWWSILLLHGAGHAVSLSPAELAKKLPDVIFLKVDDVNELKVKVGKAVGFEILKDQNASDPDFGQIWANRQNGMLVNFLVQEAFLF